MACWAALAILVFYPLSVGPAWWLCFQSESKWAIQTYNAVFAPLGWAADKNETVGGIVILYVGWWAPKPKRLHRPELPCQSTTFVQDATPLPRPIHTAHNPCWRGG